MKTTLQSTTSSSLAGERWRVGTFPEGEGVPAIDGIRVGIGGWTYAPWRSNFYPEGLVQRRELEYASRRLSTIEVNGTFYGAQKPSTYARWAAETPEHFVFSLKAPQHVTQRGPLAKATRAANTFLSGGLNEFGERLGPVLWQMPPSRAFDPEDLRAFLESLPRDLDGLPLRHVVEVRHPSFQHPEFVDLMREQDAAIVFTDSPDYPSIADLTGPVVYARLMRSRAELADGYSPGELDQWAARAHEWADGGDPGELPHAGAAVSSGRRREVFLYFISSAKQRNPAAAVALLSRLGSSSH